ncbi:MAG: hypothetical protein SFY80_00325 [Verrucomicrobiota bacterium]|nr:hypothetical protein [Verrucomicrobiota bacterium]
MDTHLGVFEITFHGVDTHHGVFEMLYDVTVACLGILYERINYK